MALSDGLIGYWSPWLGSSGYRLIDRTRYANHGTLTNMDAGTDWVGATVQGRSGFALDFDGLSDVSNRDFVSLGSPIGLNKVQTGLSVFLWIKPTSVSGTRTIWSAYKSTVNSELYSMIRLEGTTLKYYTSTSAGGFQAVGTLTITNNTWSLVGFTVAGTIASAVSTTFINLSSQANNLSALSATPADGVDFRISAPQSTTSAEAFQGQVAEACGWNRVLNLTEAQHLYRLGPGWYQPYQRKRYAFVAGVTFNRRRRILCGDYS